jgi:hypothetical protein
MSTHGSNWINLFLVRATEQTIVTVSTFQRRYPRLTQLLLLTLHRYLLHLYAARFDEAGQPWRSKWMRAPCLPGVQRLDQRPHTPDDPFGPQLTAG